MVSVPSAMTSSTVTDVRPTVNCLPTKQLGSLLELSIFEKSFFMLINWKVLGDTIIEHSNTERRSVWDKPIYKQNAICKRRINYTYLSVIKL